MKRTLIIVVMLLFVVGITGMANAQITGSPHDFAGDVAWSVATGEICKPCHAPHTTNTAVDSLLWNHDVTGVASYQTYTSSTLNDTPGQPDGHSKLCLSCHDGTVSVNAFPGEGGGPMVTGSLQIAKGGDDLRGQHPISILYDAGANSDDNLNYPASTVNMGANTLDQLLDTAGKVQCSTCHDVHNTLSEANGPKLLRLDNTGSLLCLACHAK